MSTAQEAVAISEEQEAAAHAFNSDMLATVKAGLEIWLNQPIEVTSGTLEVDGPEEARAKLPNSGFGYVVTLNSKSPHVTLVADRRMLKAVIAASRDEDPADSDDVDTSLDDGTREAIEGFGSFLAGGVFDREIHRAEDGRHDADLTVAPLTDSSWVDSEDPLLGTERFAVFESRIAIGDAQPGAIQLFMPWGYVASLFNYISALADEEQSSSGDAAGGSAGVSAATFDPTSPEETMSIAALVKREPPPPPPTGAPPRVRLSELHRVRSKRLVPIRYMRGHQMRQTRELSPIYLIGSPALLQMLSAAHQDREVLHLPDARDLSKRMDSDGFPAAVIVHCPKGHEPWMMGWVGEAKFRENIDRQPVVVVLEEPSSESVQLCGEVGLVNVVTIEADPNTVLELIAPHLD